MNTNENTEQKVTPEIHQWTHKSDRVLIVKIVGKNGQTKNGFTWPLTVGAIVRPVNHSRKPDCESGGLFGWAWGLIVGDGKDVNSAGKWLVFSAKPENVVNVGGLKCKVVPDDKNPEECARVEYVGSQAGAMQFTIDGRIAWIMERSRGSASATGDRGSASATGDSGSASATGYGGSASATGDSGSASATGYGGSASATWSRGSASATGDSGSASATGDGGSASATGDGGSASATGYGGSASATGENSISMATGIFGKAKGAMGVWLVASEWVEKDGKWHRKTVKTVLVDGKKIKADTWYSIKNGKWVKA